MSEFPAGISDVRLRRATVDDLPKVYEFELAYIREIEPDAEPGWIKAIPLHLKQWVTNLPRMFVALREEEIIGHCFWQADGTDAVLASLFVTPTWRRKGFGQLLLTQFEEDARAQGFTRLTLGVYKTNPARALYLQAGYAEAQPQDGYLCYEKRLLRVTQ